MRRMLVAATIGTPCRLDLGRIEALAQLLRSLGSAPRLEAGWAVALMIAPEAVEMMIAPM